MSQPNCELRQEIMRSLRMMRPGDMRSFTREQIEEAFPPTRAPLPVQSSFQIFWELMPGSGFEISDWAFGYKVRKT